MHNANKENAQAQRKLHYKNEAKPQGNGLHESKNFNATKFQSNAAPAAGAQNQQQNIKLSDVAASYKECYNSGGHLQLQSVIKEETPSKCDDIGEAPTVSFEPYQQLLQILNKMSNQIASLQSGMNSLLQRKNMTNISTTTMKINGALKANESASRDQSSGSPPDQGLPHLDTVDAFKIRNFQKIKNEAELEAFEQRLQDEQFAIKAEESFKRIVGKKPKRKFCKRVLLQLSSAIFDKTFWAQTNWLGTTDGSVEKFALSKHSVFLEFFKNLLRHFFKPIPRPAYVAAFFQSLANRSCQPLATKANQGLNSRARVEPVKDETTQNEIKQDETLEEEGEDLDTI